MATATPKQPADDDAPHLLIVDDDARIRDLLQRFLSDKGYRITAAETARRSTPQDAGHPV